MTEVALYDLNKEHPKESGDTFRSVQVFRCPICRSLTNRIEVFSWHYHQRHTRAVCPHMKEEWHQFLRGKLRLHRQPHPDSYQQELKKEIASLREEHASDNLEGETDLSSEEWIDWYTMTPEPVVIHTGRTKIIL